MNFHLTDEQRMMQQAARDFARRELAPRAAEYDRTGRFPAENWQALREAGYVGLTVAEEYGGAGLDLLTHTLCLEEFARACASTAVILEVHNSLVSEIIQNWGSEEQKARFLPRLASGEVLGAYALTEPEAGSDAAGLRTRAVRRGDRYILSGSKAFITNAGVAGLYVVFASTDPGAGRRGISAFLVEGETPGLRVGPPEKKLGLKASQTCPLWLADVEVPAENLLGPEGAGYRLALATLDCGRVGIGAQSVGVLQAALDASLAYAKERRQFGRSIAEFQAIQFKLAEMATDLEAARLLVYRAAALYGEGGRHSKEISMAKLFASRAAVRHTLEAIQIHGGYGYLEDYGVERLLRDVKAAEIYEGTNEIQHLVIAGALLAE